MLIVLLRRLVHAFVHFPKTFSYPPGSFDYRDNKIKYQPEGQIQEESIEKKP